MESYHGGNFEEALPTVPFIEAIGNKLKANVTRVASPVEMGITPVV
jgi:hypothetical protein